MSKPQIGCTFCGADRPLPDGSCSNCGKPAPKSRAGAWELQLTSREALLRECLRALNYAPRFAYSADRRNPADSYALAARIERELGIAPPAGSVP